MDILLISFIIALAVQVIGFPLGYILKSDKFTDLSYSLTFFIIAAYLFIINPITSAFHIILLAMVLIWSIRLGTYLLIRIMKMGKDKRFDMIRSKFPRFFAFWLFQGITAWVVMLGYILFFKYAFTFSLISLLGVVIWLKGFFIETIADYQKYKFKSNHKNKNKFVTTGLWKFSRHPNYYGEFLMWLGIFIFVIPSLSLSYALLALLSPVYILILLLFFSGIPMIEKSYIKRYKTKYKDYMKKTSKFILWPPKK